MKDIDESVVIREYETGSSAAKVAKALGISATQVRRILKRNGVGRRSNRTDAETEALVLERYERGENSEEIAESMGLHGTTVCRIIKRTGGRVRPAEENKRKYRIRSGFFSVIDEEAKAYALGFLFADGNVHKKTNMIKIEVHEQDLDVLHHFIGMIFIDPPTIGVDRGKYRYITINSGRMKADLMGHGCVPGKTFKTALPLIDDGLMGHFLRGVYDGDGCISVTDRVRLNLTGHSSFLKQIMRFWEGRGIFASYSELKPGVGSLTIGSEDGVHSALCFLYDKWTICLKRKHDKYIEALRRLTASPNRYATNIFSYKGQKVTGKWLEIVGMEQRVVVADAAFRYFRRHGFPYPSFTTEERSQDFKRLCTTNATLEGDRIASANDAGLKLFKHYCRHYFDVRSNALPSMTDAFRDDDKLMAVIHNRMGISYKETFNITGNMIRQGLRNSHTAFAASVFKPSVAKLIYDEFARDGNVLDISAGFGQRMIGAAASLRAESYTGIDLWKTTIDALGAMHEAEFPWFPAALHCCGSESFAPKKKYSLCFSSPPFFDKEVYCDDGAQAYHGRDLRSFVNDWWLPTAGMVHGCLNADGVFVLNMDESIAKDMVEASKKLFRVVRKMHLSFSRSHLPKGSTDTYFVMERA